jgi:hypothetical protein
MATRRDDPFAVMPWLEESGASPARDRWDAGSSLNTLVEDMAAQMGEHFAYLALARVSALVGGYLPAGSPPAGRSIVIEVLSALSPQERLALVSDDPRTIEPKAAAIVERAIFLSSFIHGPA